MKSNENYLAGHEKTQEIRKQWTKQSYYIIAMKLTERQLEDDGLIFLI